MDLRRGNYVAIGVVQPFGRLDRLYRLSPDSSGDSHNDCGVACVFSQSWFEAAGLNDVEGRWRLVLCNVSSGTTTVDALKNCWPALTLGAY